MIINRTQKVNGSNVTTAVAEVPVTAKAVHKATLMKEDFIKLVFDSDVDYKFKAGDWVELEQGGMPYILADDYFPTMKDEATFSYELQFNAPWYNLYQRIFLFNTYVNGSIVKRESDWYITDTAKNILSLIILSTQDEDRECPCAFNEVLDCEPTVVKTFTFSSTSILSALNNLAKEFELEWWVTYEGGEYYLHFGECDNSITRDANGAVTFDGETNVRERNSALAVHLTAGENVTKPSVSQKEGLKRKYYVFGSSRNIDQNAVQDMENGFVTSIVTKRLELAGNPQDMGEGSGEEVVIFDDIYPRSDYQITGVTPVEIITDEVLTYDEQGNPAEYKRYNVYNLQIEGFSDYIFSLINNDPNVQNVEDIIASGKPLSLKFITKEVSGETVTPKLAGFEFELAATLVTDEATGNSWYEFQIQHQDINGYIVPNDNLIPEAGDWVCIFNVKGAYIGGTNSNNGQDDLRAAFNKWYANKKRDVSYTVKPYANEDIDLEIGDAVVLSYKDNTVTSRVYSYEKALDLLLAGLGCSDASYTISSYAKTGSVNQLKEDVKVLTASIANGTAGGSIDASSVQNAIATYGRRLFLSKTTEDKADGHITFKEGITSQKESSLQRTTFGTFNSGFLGSGAVIDEYGNAEVKSLYSREFISTPEFRFNRITVTEGEQWNTNGFGIIEEVKQEGALWYAYLRLEEGDIPSVDRYDFCRGIYNNIGYKEENDVDGYDTIQIGDQTYDIDNQPDTDACNFPTKDGFFTSYFQVLSKPEHVTENGVKRWRFRFSTKGMQQGYSDPLPCKNMKFAQYGNDRIEERQSSLYQTSIRHSYIQQLENVNTWEINSWNIASRYGYLGDLTVTLKNSDGSTYNTTLQGNGLYVQDNVYFGNATIQLDPVTIEDIKSQLANYSVQLSAYTDVIKVDDAGNVIEGLWTDTGEAPNISRQYRIFSVITARNGITPLTIEEDDVPCGKGKFKVYVQPYGCSCLLENSTLFITHIDNVKDGIAGTEDDVNFDYDACRAMERVWVDLRVECEGVGSILATMPITIKHDPVPYIIADLTNENASVSWSSDEERYIGLPIETFINMSKGNEDLKIDDVFINTINGHIPNWTNPRWSWYENAYIYEEEIDFFHPSPTAGWGFRVTPCYMAATDDAPAVGNEDRPLGALIRVVKMPIVADSVTEVLITCHTTYAGVYYERTLSLHISRFADVGIWDIIPTHHSVSVDRNAFFNHPYVGVNVFCTDKSGRKAVTTLPSGFLLQYKISEVISSFTPVLNPTGNPAEQGWFEIEEIVDTDGLIGHWDCGDELVTGQWVDKVNSMAIVLGGTAAKTTDGIRLNNLSAPKNAYTYLNTSHNTFLNQQIDKEFTCIIDCLVKFGEANRRAMIIDFGSLGASASGVSVLASVGQGGSVSASPKYNGNSSSGYETRVSSASGADAITLNQYVNIQVKVGARLIDGKQEVYAEALGLKAYGIANTPLKVNFSGCGGSINWAFGFGVLYLSGTAVTQYGGDYLADVVYKRILLYNKSKQTGITNGDYIRTSDTSVQAGKTYYVHSYASADREPVTLSDPTAQVRVNDPSYADTIKSIIFTLFNETNDVADEEEVLVIREGLGGQGSTGPAGNGVQQVTDYYLRAKDGFTPHYPDPLGYIPEGSDEALVETAQAYPSGWRAKIYTPPTKDWPNVWHFTKYDYTSSPDYDTTPSLITTYAEDGNNIVGVHTYYLRTNEDNVNNILRLDQGGTGWIQDEYVAPDNLTDDGHGRFVWRYFAFQYSKETNGSYYVYTPIEFVAKWVEDGASFQCAYKVFPAKVEISGELVDYIPTLDSASTGANMPATNNSSWSSSTTGLVVSDGYVLWMTERTYKGTNYGTWGSPVRISGHKGETGADGTDIEFIYKLSNDGNPSAAEKPTYGYDETNQLPWSTTIDGTTYSSDDDDFNPSHVPNATGSNLGWTDNPSGIGDNNGTFYKYEWCCQRTKKKGEEHWGGWIGPFVWSAYGDKGMDGDGVEYVFKLSPTRPSQPNSPTFKYGTNQFTTSKVWDGNVEKVNGVWMPVGWTPPSGQTFQGWIGGSYNPQGEWIPNGDSVSEWTDDPTGVSPTNQKEWVAIRKKVSGKWGAFSELPALWATYAETPNIRIVDGYWWLGNDYLRDENGDPVRAEGQNGTGIAIKGRREYFSELLQITPVPKKGDCYIISSTRHLWVYVGDETAGHTIVAADWEDMGEFQGADGANSQLHFAWARNMINGVVNVQRDQQTGEITSITEFVTAYEDLDRSVDYEWQGIATTNSVDNPAKLDPDEWDAYKWNYVKGRDGEFFERIFMLTSLFVAPTVNTNYSASDFQQPEFRPQVLNASGCGAAADQFFDDPIGTSEFNLGTYQYEWMLERKKVDGVWQPFSDATLWARYAKDGEGIDRVDTWYLKTTMATGVNYNTDGGQSGGNWVKNVYQIPDADKPYVWRYSEFFSGSVSVDVSGCELIAVYSSAPNVNLLDDTAFSSDVAMEAWGYKGYVKHEVVNGVSQSADPTADPSSPQYDSQNFNNFFGVTTGTQGYNAYLGRFRGTNTSAYIVLLQQEIINAFKTKIEAGKWYTLSYWVKGNAESMFDVSFRGVKNGATADYIDKTAGMYVNGTLRQNIHSYQFKYNSGHYSTEWAKHVITFKVLDNLDVDSAFVQWTMYNRTTEHQIFICMPKLEVGLVATTYTEGQTSTKAFPRTGEWRKGEQYYAGNIGERYIDAVHYGLNNFGYPAWFKCIRTHISSDENSPTSANGRLYWDAGSWDGFIATGLLLAQYAFIENLGVGILRTGEPDEPHVEMFDSIARFFGDGGHKSIELATDDDGVGVLRFYDKAGNAMYDLGPNGIMENFSQVPTSFLAEYYKPITTSSMVTALVVVGNNSVSELGHDNAWLCYKISEGYKALRTGSNIICTYNISESDTPSAWNGTRVLNNNYTDSQLHGMSPVGNGIVLSNGWYCGSWIGINGEFSFVEIYHFVNGKIITTKKVYFKDSDLIANGNNGSWYDEAGNRYIHQSLGIIMTDDLTP